MNVIYVGETVVGLLSFYFLLNIYIGTDINIAAIGVNILIT